MSNRFRMESEVRSFHVLPVPRAQAEAELERLLADTRFRVSDRNRAFLKYLVDARYSGMKVKAYMVAVDVFGRSENFDAAIDPIVRIEATRLRSALEQYYEAFGHETSVQIELPRGGYVAELRRTKPARAVAGESDRLGDDQPVQIASHDAIGFKLLSGALIVGAVIAVIGGIALAVHSLVGGAS